MGHSMSSFPLVDGSFVRQTGHATSVREQLSAAFRRATAGSRSPTKELARVIDRTPRGAEMILKGETAPSAEALILAMRQYDDVWEAVKEMAGRADSESDAERVLAEITERLKARRA